MTNIKDNVVMVPKLLIEEDENGTVIYANRLINLGVMKVVYTLEKQGYKVAFSEDFGWENDFTRN